MGNKKRLINKGLIDLFPRDIDTFVDVFAGSAIVSMNTTAYRYIVNDIDNNLNDLYKLFCNAEPDFIISHINKRIDEYGLSRERTKRNEYHDIEQINTTEFLYSSGAREVHVRPACPPLLYGCKFLNFSRSNSEYDLITRRIIREREGENVSDEVLADYADPDSTNYKEMLEGIRKQLGFTSLRFHRVDDMVKSVGIDKSKLCTYCWDKQGDCSSCAKKCASAK